MKSSPAVLLAVATVFQSTTNNSAQEADWTESTISPVTNPLFFEDPQIRSEVRPLFIYHNIHDSFATGGGIARVYAVQARWAVTDRLAIIATKDGYIDLDLPGGGGEDGWADIGAGLKYALIDDRENQFILTPGFKFELPSGNRDVFQGNGKGEWNLFVSSAKGFGSFHVTGSAGVRLPNDWDKETASAHYSIQFDYHAHQYFIPFVAANGFTTLSDAEALPFKVEGYDLINFGSADAKGFTQITVGGGFRSRILTNLDVGVAYEVGVTRPRGLFDDRFTVDMIYRF